MRKAALLYNPESGGSKRRQRELQSALETLKAGGVEAELFASDSREHWRWNLKFFSWTNHFRHSMS